MKKTVLIAGLLWAASLQIQAQTAVWHDANSGNPEAQAIHRMWADLYAAYNTPDIDKAMGYYTKESGIIDIGGNLQLSSADAGQGMAEMLKQMDPKPKFYYGNLKTRLLSDGMAIVVYDSWMEYQGKKLTTVAACDLLSKKNGVWRIEFEQMTPVMQASEGK